jgi:hypothetical protein
MSKVDRHSSNSQTCSFHTVSEDSCEKIEIANTHSHLSIYYRLKDTIAEPNFPCGMIERNKRRLDNHIDYQNVAWNNRAVQILYQPSRDEETMVSRFCGCDAFYQAPVEWGVRFRASAPWVCVSQRMTTRFLPLKEKPVM